MYSAETRSDVSQLYMFYMMKTFTLFPVSNARLGISPNSANVVKHVKVESHSQSGRQLLLLLKSPSTLHNEGN